MLANAQSMHYIHLLRNISQLSGSTQQIDVQASPQVCAELGQFYLVLHGGPLLSRCQQVAAKLNQNVCEGH